MAVVDANYKFRYIDVGSEGRCSDAGVWNKCSMSHRLESGQIVLPASEPLRGGGEPMPYVFVADDAFGMKMHIMKPYSRDLDEGRRIYNYR